MKPNLDVAFMNIERSCIETLAHIQDEISNRVFDECFTPDELARFQHPNAFRSLFARYLAKKMILTALGSGLCMTDISIENNTYGAPLVQADTGEAKAYFKQTGIRKIHLSFAHSREWIGVFLIIDYF